MKNKTLMFDEHGSDWEDRRYERHLSYMDYTDAETKALTLAAAREQVAELYSVSTVQGSEAGRAG